MYTGIAANSRGTTMEYSAPRALMSGVYLR